MRKGVKCKDCFYYPDDCGYWEEKFRKKEESALPKDAIHGCMDFKGKTYEIETKHHDRAN